MKRTDGGGSLKSGVAWW